MQFYFPAEVNRNLIANCLRFWRLEYHVDGFHIYGAGLPLDVLATDPMITDAKLYYERYEASGIYGTDTSCVNESLAEFNQDFAVDIRRFLKSDEDMLHKFVYRLRCNPDRIRVINHLTSYDGFTLNDLVSYDYKHNEANGEEIRTVPLITTAGTAA
jgi:glycogen operon protein